MLSFSDCHTIIEDQIKLLDVKDKKPVELYAPISYILGLGGKRIRPVTALMACNLFTDDVAPAVGPALAIEVFHNFTLVHDDIMDNASMRRNKPTVHAKWNDNIAILSGDAMQVYAYQLLSRCNSNLLKPLMDVFNATALEVCEGQQLDMNFASLNQVSLQNYLYMIELKTSVLLAASLKVGAICGKAPEDEAQKLYEFGLNLGLAFQIQDDYLDVYGDQDLFGKKVGGDIAENKKTFLLVKAIELAEGDDAKTLQKALSNKITNIFEKIETVRSLYDNLNIPQVACDTIADYSHKAFECLESVNVDRDKKVQLSDLAKSLMSREK